MNKRTLDLLAGIFVLVLSLGVFTVTRGFPLGRPGIPGPNYFPNLIASAMAICAIVLLVRTFLASRHAMDEEDAPKIRTSSQGYLMVVATVLLSLAYISLVEWLGFLLTTILFLVSLTVVYKTGNWWKNILYAISLTLVTYVVFARLLLVQLPMGLFG